MARVRSCWKIATDIATVFREAPDLLNMRNDTGKDAIVTYSGADLIEWGFKPGAWFKEALVVANTMQGASLEEVRTAVSDLLPEDVPKVSLRPEPLEYARFIEPENEVERENVGAVDRAMAEIMRVPTIRSGAIMPDACPTGPLDIPVGGVVAAENAIHPGFHSSDVCCSMAITVFDEAAKPSELMDAAEKYVHFGPTTREEHQTSCPDNLIEDMGKNPFLKGLESYARYHFLTQGDGNHFYFVGRLETTGQPAIVSHHGSRGLGAKLYKRGMRAAQNHTRKVSPETPKSMAWIEADSDEGLDYWDALQFVRRWTKANHYAVHDLIAQDVNAGVLDRFWNEHNFVFRKTDGLYYHAKGATPSYDGFSPDDDGRTLIPMNMAEPILIAAHGRKAEALEFAPHGAGRNVSRTTFLKENSPKYPEGIDVRFWCGIPDASELPDAYKSAAQVQDQISKHGLANVIDRVLPFGSIMAGDWEQEAPWKVKAREKAKLREASS